MKHSDFCRVIWYTTWHGKRFEDGYSEEPENRYAVRMMIVRLSKWGLDPMTIKEQTGVSHVEIRKVLDLYAAGGTVALRPKTHGCKKGTAKRLTDEQEKDIQNAIRDKRSQTNQAGAAQEDGGTHDDGYLDAGAIEHRDTGLLRFARKESGNIKVTQW